MNCKKCGNKVSISLDLKGYWYRGTPALITVCRCGFLSSVFEEDYW